MSLGYGINSRDSTKLIKLTDSCVLASAGMAADASNLHKMMGARMQMFKHNHHKEMPTTAIAQMLSNTLYSRRFFPLYTFNIVGGLDAEGKGCVYGYDAIGSYERSNCIASGTGQSLLQPLIDNQVDHHNQTIIADGTLSKDGAVDLIKDAFTSAGERDIYTGDAVEIAVITAAGVEMIRFDLKKD